MRGDENMIPEHRAPVHPGEVLLERNGWLSPFALPAAEPELAEQIDSASPIDIPAERVLDPWRNDSINVGP